MEYIDRELSLIPIPQTATQQILTKRRKHRKLRRLGEDADDTAASATATPTATTKSNKRRLLVFAAAFLILAVLGHVYCTDNSAHNALDHFFTSYRRHYNQIVHGRSDYCSPKLDTVALFRQIDKYEILHQEMALRQIHAALHNISKLNALAVVGPAGVGKSLFARALASEFPWPDNVHSYAWNTYVEDEVERVHMLRLFAERLSSCGQNLLIIDNLTPCDREVVHILNELIARADGGGSKHVIVLYIFNLNTMLANGISPDVYKSLQSIENTKTINFKAFAVEELKSCIRREARMANVTLSQRSYDELLQTIDVQHSGCKNAYAKVVAFGETETE